MNRSIRRMILPLVALSMGALGFYHVQHSSQSMSPTVPPQDPPQAAYAHAVAGTGVVEAQTENIAIGTALPGLVLEVYVPSSKVGQRVKAGMPLFRSDDRHLKAQLAVAMAQLASAKTALAKLQQQPRPEELPVSLARVKAATAKMVLWEDQYQRAEKLFHKASIAHEEFVTRQRTYETAVHEKAQAQAEYDLLRAGAWEPDLAIARAAVKEAQAKVEQLKVEIGRALVVAPVDGVILQVNIRPGERVSEFDNKTLMVLGGMDAIHVRIDVDERDIPRFRPGASAKAYPRGDARCELPLRFVRVEPLVVPKKSLTGDNTERVDTRVLQVIYAIEAHSAPVYVGQQLDAFIQSDE
jgi:multidrug resistance efflux pump